MSGAGAQIEAFFVDAPRGYRLYVRYRPAHQPAPRGGILFAHPFAEEMNKSRHLVAAQAREFARLGWDVLIVDFLGCGDSSGDFGDATWSVWREDLLQAYHWLVARTAGPMWLWGLRAGCLLTTDLSTRITNGASLILWQPVLSGRQHLHQFLRTRTVRHILKDGERTSDGRNLRAELAAAGALEVAGYSVSERMAAELEQAELSTPPAGATVAWFEVSQRDPPEIGPMASQRANTWMAEGVKLDLRPVSGPPFWQVQDIDFVDCPELIAATTQFLHASFQ